MIKHLLKPYLVPVSTMKMLASLCLCACIVALFLPSSVAGKERVALVIGIDRYPQLPADKQLRKAGNDARAIAKALSDVGFKVSLGENVRRREFNRLWARFLNRLSPGDVAAFFFSGHGVELSGENFLIPGDIPKLSGNDETLLRGEAVSMQRLLVDLRDKRPRVKLLIIDACRDNPFSDGLGRSLGATRGLARVTPPSGTFMMYSAGAGQKALDRLSNSDGNPNSVYTRSLLPLIKQDGLRIQDVAIRVRRKVYKLAKRIGHKQRPAYYDEVLGRFCLSGCGGEEPNLAGPMTNKCDGVRARVRGESRCLSSGDSFRDCPKCPEMVVVPAGSFWMGSEKNDPGANANETPPHHVTISKPFAVGKFEVTFAEWAACVADGGCNGYSPRDSGWGRGRRPVINVSWDDARAYVAWLREKTGRDYRLLSEAAWEYAARAGRPWHVTRGPSPREARYASAGHGEAMTTKVAGTVEVGSFPPNAFGLHDMAGNVWEWVADCWHADHAGAPGDGSPRTTGDCGKHVLKGGSWAVISRGLRPAFRAGIRRYYRDDDAGFRVARPLNE